LRTDEPPSTVVSTLDETLALHDWPLPIGQPIRGLVLMLHGLGEHIGQYTELANHLNQWGFAVRGYDQYGHGESIGVRGDLPCQDRLLDDLADVIDDTRARMDDRLPLIVLGHGLGGLTAGLLASMKLRRLEGLTLSSPPFCCTTSLGQRALLKVLNTVAPHWRLDSGIHPDDLTHDLAMLEVLRNDGLRHDRMSARMANFILTRGAALLARAPRWKVPTLLLYAGQDALADPKGSEQFAQAAPAEWVTAHQFPMHFHALFQEMERQPVYDALQHWLWTRYPALTLEQPFAPTQPVW
jgi:alpha-beta hydrolase superfamily lysophospholipase